MDAGKIIWTYNLSFNGAHSSVEAPWFRTKAEACADAAKRSGLSAHSLMRRKPGGRVKIPSSFLTSQGHVIRDGLTICSVDGYDADIIDKEAKEKEA